ncbi:MAG TPA: SRPBCC domain-containing protein [Polyangia bacterium]|jgi:uncharacterized protein YndB with AHSA1/START domain|nr:SRPBCC domain-containing protein [Polyangia bacterium]
MSSQARAVADLSAGKIVATVEIAAPIARVFAAITDADAIPRWWGSADTYRTTSHTADLRPGGKWRSVGVGRDGHEFSVGGEFLTIEPPRLLVQTWNPSWDEHPTTITYRLEPLADGGTRVTVRHEGFGDRTESCKSHGEGWERVLGWLAAYASGAR